jgi:hypothetical protein
MDELKGLLAAGGMDFDNPNATPADIALLKGIYKRLTGDPEAAAASRVGFESPAVKDLEIAPRAINEFGQGIRAKLNEAGIDENLAPKTFGVLSKLEKVPEDAFVTGQNLQSLRRTFQNAAGTPDKTERLAASKVIDAIDEFIPNVAARDILSGDPKAAAQAWATARGNYAAAMRSDEIAKVLIKAQRQADAAGSGANIDNATRQQFKAILNSDKSYHSGRPSGRPFSLRYPNGVSLAKVRPDRARQQR